ncbi:MAG: GHKL domain-containing protein [PVC group bacterium]|nr:GHKL domain-containing protein [PVC group bacterium]
MEDRDKTKEQLIEEVKVLRSNLAEMEFLEAKYRKVQNFEEAQEELVQSNKMIAIGQLAAGISHELNQPLTGVRGFAQAVFMDLETDSPLRDDVAKIIQEADRMDRIIKSVRFFAGSSKSNIKKLDINRSLEDSLSLLEKELQKKNIRLIAKLDNNLPELGGDVHQLEQVFLNLINNAKDAIESLDSSEGGELRVNTELSENGKNIVVKFEDTGCGISPDKLENVFNPFYTTKSPDKGMGMGLSIVYRVVEQHKGTVGVASEEGKGTSFTITFPLQSADMITF